MEKHYWIFVLLLGGVVIISGCYHKATQPLVTPVATNSIEIKEFAFNPTIVTITKGTTVTWTQKDNTPHTVTGSDFDSGSLSRGQTFSKTFDEAGTFEYKCLIHPSMRGKVIVR